LEVSQVNTDREGMKGMKYHEYVRDYWDYDAGEHHLVAIFIIPELQNALGVLPIFVNPDGMKSIPGDIVYACERRNFTIEVKLKKLCLTKTQYSPDYNPDVLLHFDYNKIGIADWNQFQNEYVLKMEKLRVKGRKYDKYGPVVNANELKSIEFHKEDEIFTILQSYDRK